MKHFSSFLLFLVFISFISCCFAIRATSAWNAVKIDDVMKHVKNIAIERVVDTEGHKVVEKYITDTFEKYAPNWKMEKDIFVDRTPIGEKTFVNLIATLDAVPGQISDKYLVLGAHYDSKWFPNFKFDGAIDSAVPCSILIDFAIQFENLAPESLLNGYNGHNWGIKIIFFDGEEAFHEWTPVDSIYGSRHLAEDWALDSGTDLISKIDAFFLLDLLGAPNTAPIPSRYTSTDSQFDYLFKAQQSLKAAGKIPQKTMLFTQTRQPEVTIEDDHIPWLRRGVPIVHVIPAPFPVVWHQSTDTYENVDPKVVRQLTSIFHLAMFNYLEQK